MTTSNLTSRQRSAVVLLRIFIGWHFLYEGVIKLFNANWTAKYYLLSSEGFASPLFSWLAGDGMIGFINTMNILCLIVVGLALLIGMFEKLGAIVGIALLLLYYLAHPAFPGLEQAGTEGSYFLVNKNLIEAAALYVLYLMPTGAYFGIQGLFKSNSLKTSNA